tara:strand:- start:964 stop:1323 length:360 start_codon:yes stop_codon:yes gene_type:complete
MYQNDIPDLESISNNRYENIFNVATTEENKYYFYNISRAIRFDDTSIDPAYYYKFIVNRLAPYTALSHTLYGTMELWWLICVINNIDSPVKFLTPGTTIKVIKKQYVSTVIDNIKRQLQ